MSITNPAQHGAEAAAAHAMEHAIEEATEKHGDYFNAENTGTVSSMQDLKNQSPEVYDAMMEGIAMQICSESRRAQERLRKISREARQDG